MLLGDRGLASWEFWLNANSGAWTLSFESEASYAMTSAKAEKSTTTRHSAAAKQVRAPGYMRRSFRTHRLCAIPGVSPRAGIGVGMAVVGHPSLRTGQAGFPHPALQSMSHPLAAGLVRSARAKAYREISPCFSKNALG